HIELSVIGSRHHAGRLHHTARPKGDAKTDDRAKAIGAHERCLPSNSSAPVVADDKRARRLQSVEHADHVADQMEDRVLVNSFRLIAHTIAAHIRGNGMKTCCRKAIDLVTPRIPRFWEAVGQQYQRSGSLFGDVEMNAVALDDTLCRLAHLGLLFCKCRRTKALQAVTFVH